MKNRFVSRIGALVFLSVGIASASAGSFTPGEILVEQLGSTVQRYSATGVHEQDYTGFPREIFIGDSVTPGGNLVVSFRRADPGLPSPRVYLFNPDGTVANTFGTPPINLSPGDVSVFANGTLAINDQTNDAVVLYTQAGTLIKSVTLPGVNTPLGSAVGRDNVLYVAGFNNNTLSRLAQDGTLIGATVSLAFQPGDIAVSPLDGTLWVSGAANDRVEHLLPDGTPIGSFDTGLTGSFFGIGLSPDGLTIDVTTSTSTVLRQFTLTGAQLDDIPLAGFGPTNPGQPGFITVVPAAVPEPAGLPLAGVLATLLGYRKRT